MLSAEVIPGERSTLPETTQRQGKKKTPTKTQGPGDKKHLRNHLEMDAFRENEGGITLISLGFSKSSLQLLYLPKAKAAAQPLTLVPNSCSSHADLFGDNTKVLQYRVF